jgi:hypothetical protein
MPRIAFDELPDHGRLWVFPASRDLTDTEARECLGAVDEFLSTWSAHGVPLRSGRELVGKRFLLVGVDVDAEAPSGCSIDALVNRLRALGDAAGLTLIDHAPVWFRDGDTVRMLPRAEFRALATSGALAPDVPVFDTSLTRMAQAREGALERPASESWHGKAFFRAPASRGVTSA